MVIGWGYGDRAQGNGCRTAINDVPRRVVADLGLPELLELAKQLHSSEGAERSGFAQQFGTSIVNFGKNKRRRACLDGGLGDQNRLRTIVCGGV